MKLYANIARALFVPLVCALALGVPAGSAFAKKGGLDDSTREDDDGRSKGGSSTSGSSNSGSSGSGSGGGAASSATGGRDGYDRVSVTEAPSVEDALEQSLERSLDQHLRNNERDRGDRFR